jgi:signal transduction histidine kinase
MRPIHLFLFLTLSLYSLGQSPEIRQYKEIIAQSENDTARLEAMLRMGYAYIYIDPDSTFYWADRSDQLSKDIGLLNFQVHALSVRGSAYWAMGRYDRALDHFFKALKGYEDQGDVLGKADCFGNIAIIYDIQGLSENAIRYGRQDQRVRVEQGDMFGLANAHLNLGTFFLNNLQADSATKYFVLSQSLAREIGFDNVEANASVNLANMHMIGGEHEMAIPLLLRSESVFLEEGNLYDLAETYWSLARCQFALDKMDEALFYLDLSLDMAEKVSAEHLLMDAYSLRIRLDSAANDMEALMRDLKLYESHKDSIFNAESAEKIAELRTTHELELKEQENELLREEAHIQKKNIRQANAITLISTLAAVLVIILLFLQFRYNNVIKKKSAELEEEHRIAEARKAELEELNARLEELNQIKNQLFSIISHDFRSPLVALYNTLQLLELEGMGPDMIRAHSEGLSAQTENTLEMLDNILHWANLQMKGVEVEESEVDLNHELNAILELFEPQLKRKEISVQRSVSPELKTKIDPNALHLAMRNVLSNAIKYSPRGEEISISANEEEGRIHLLVQDRGAGMDKDQLKELFTFGTEPRPGTENEKGTGLGLALSYLFLIRNKASIEAHTDNGTLIKIILPYA